MRLLVKWVPCYFLNEGLDLWIETHCDKFLLSVGAEAVQIIEDTSFIMLQSFPILHIWENIDGKFHIYLFLASLCTWYWADSLLPVYMYPRLLT